MTRIEACTKDALASEPAAAAVLQRREGAFLKMDLVMLHSPVFTRAWNDFSRVITGELSLTDKLSQFVMCVIGVANGVDYQVRSHAPKFLAAGGRQAQLDALTDIPRSLHDESLFDEQERAAAVLALKMTRNVHISDATFNAAVSTFDSNQNIVDLVGLIAAYNMVSRFVAAFDIDAE